MLEIRPSSDLRNKYNEISQFCHENGKPIYMTRNGKENIWMTAFQVIITESAEHDLHAIIDYVSKVL